MANSKWIGRVLLATATLGGCIPASNGTGTPLIIAPASWTSLYRQPTSSALRAVRAAGLNTAIVAGDATSILRTDDGGTTWIQLDHRPHARGGDIFAMDFYNLHGESVGRDSKDSSKGRFWYTGNGAFDSATADTDAVGPVYVSVDVVSDTATYRLRADGVVERDDAGFLNLLPPLPAGTWTSIDFLGTTGVGYAAGDNRAIAIFSGGVWTLQTTPDPSPNPAYNLKKIQFLDTLHGFACGDQASILVTADGGTTWTQSNYASGGAVLRSLHFPLTSTKGWAVGDGGAILATADGGLTWPAQTVPLPFEDLFDVNFTSDLVGWAVGDHGLVLRTVDGGATGWVRVPQQSTPDSLTPFFAVDFSNDGQIGLAVGPGGFIVRTLDGGRSWAPQANADTHDLLSVSLPRTGSSTVAYACGTNGTIVQTANLTAASPTWTSQSVGAATLRSILFPSGDVTGYLCGDASTLLHTTNGINWIAPVLAPPAASATWNSLSSDLSGLTVYVAGTGGISASTGNLGVSWGNLGPIPGGPDILSFRSPPGAAILFAGTNDGNVWRNLVGTWFSTTPPAGNAQGMAFADSSNGMIATTSAPFAGGIFTTDNAGLTWTRSYVHTKNLLRAVWMSPTVPGLAYAAGDNGTILRTTSNGK